MSYNMTGEEYNVLYKKYVEKGADKMFGLSLVGDRTPFDIDRYLDLCSGSNGICLNYALNLREKLGGFNHIVGVDLNPELNESFWQNIDGLETVTQDVIEFLKSEYNKSSMPDYKPFQLITCRQGINYWYNSNAIMYVASILDDGGIFIFNTFWNKPSSTKVLEYTIDGIDYVEVSILLDGMVLHSQYATGMKPHHTSFKWIPFEDLIRSCNRSFSNVVAHFDGNSVYVCCER